MSGLYGSLGLVGPGVKVGHSSRREQVGEVERCSLVSTGQAQVGSVQEGAGASTVAVATIDQGLLSEPAPWVDARMRSPAQWGRPALAGMPVRSNRCGTRM